MATFKVTFFNSGGFDGAADYVEAGGHMSTNKIKEIAEARNPGARAHTVERVDMPKATPAYRPEPPVAGGNYLSLIHISEPTRPY